MGEYLEATAYELAQASATAGSDSPPKTSIRVVSVAYPLPVLRGVTQLEEWTGNGGADEGFSGVPLPVFMYKLGK